MVASCQRNYFVPLQTLFHQTRNSIIQRLYFVFWLQKQMCIIWKITFVVCINPRSDVHTNSYPHRGTRGRGGWNPSQSFLKVEVFQNNIALSRKPLIFLTRWGMFYGWSRCWRPVTSPTMVAILDFIRNRNPVKTARTVIFCLKWKITHK